MVPSLKEKALKGLSWNLLERFGLIGVRFILGIILARLLTPEDFGLIAMITVFFTVAQVFVDSGLGSAYIQKKIVNDADANTIFYINLIISVIMYAILWLTSPAIANFYDEPQLVDLTRVMGLVVLINAFNVIQIAQINRNVDFKRKTKVSFIASSISGLSGVIAAFYGLGVWSLVIQQISNRFLNTLGLWLTNKWRPGYNFSMSSFKSMFSFGSWILLTALLRTIFDNIYILTIGKFFPVAELGYFSKSHQLQRLGSEQIASSVSIVAFPVFSQMQENKRKLQDTMRQILMYTLAFTVPLMVTLMVVSKPFVILLLKEKWAPMIPYLQLLCIVGILYPLHAINVQVLMSQGKSKLNFNLSMIKNGLRILNIIVMYRFGVIFIIIGEVIISILALTINTYYTKKLIDYGITRQIKDIYKIIIGAAISGFIAFIINLRVENLWITLLIGTVLSFGLYLCIQFIINRKFLFEIMDLKSFFINPHNNL